MYKNQIGKAEILQTRDIVDSDKTLSNRYNPYFTK